MRPSRSPAAAATLLLAAIVARAQGQAVFSIDSDDAIRRSASTLAWDMMQYYKGNLTGQTPGILPGPPPAGDYYWWEGGAMWGTLIDYWAWTGDESYNKEIVDAMLWQTGQNFDYMPHNVTASLGNDDQGFWGMSAKIAAENRFPDPPSDKPQWLALAQAVFNTQASPDRHDKTCGCGLRWQIPFANNGYNYKNSITNGCFFNLGARLARYTGNSTYSDWAIKTWDWMEKIGFIDAKTYAIYDGADVAQDCKDINKAEFTYNGVFAEGAAFMYNLTNGDPVWKDRLDKFLDHGFKTFFPNGVAVEVSCEEPGTCTTNMLTYKGFVHRWYSVVTQVAPYTADKILLVLVLKKSTQAAISQCTGGALGRQCGFKWAMGKYDGKTGAGQEMNVLAAVAAQLITTAKAPVTANSGGTSVGNPNAGGSGDSFQEFRPITAGDKAGAGVLTALVLGSACSMFGWMNIGV